MTDHGPATVDNVLAEWIIMQECYVWPQTRLNSVYPILIGRRSAAHGSPQETIGNLFSDHMYKDLSAAVPSSTLETTEKLLSENGILIKDVSVFRNHSVSTIVTDFTAWTVAPPAIVWRSAVTEASHQGASG
jgi:hypothetical protein